MIPTIPTTSWSGSTTDARHTWDKAFVAREGMVLPL